MLQRGEDTQALQRRLRIESSQRAGYSRGQVARAVFNGAAVEGVAVFRRGEPASHLPLRCRWLGLSF